MNVQLISLAAILAVLAGCPDTPPESSGNDGQVRKEIAIKQPADAASEAMTKASNADLEVATPAVNQAEAATVQDAAPESAERFDH